MPNGKADPTPLAVATKPPTEKPLATEVTALKSFLTTRGFKVADLIDIDATKNRSDIVTAMIAKCRAAKKVR